MNIYFGIWLIKLNYRISYKVEGLDQKIKKLKNDYSGPKCDLKKAIEARKTPSEKALLVQDISNQASTGEDESNGVNCRCTMQVVMD